MKKRVTLLFLSDIEPSSLLLLVRSRASILMLTLIALITSAVLPAHAAGRQFDVEVVFFKRLVDPEQTNEAWPTILTDIDLDKVGDLSDANYRRSKGVTRLSSGSYALTNQVAKLRKHAGYQVLLHTAWRQGDRGKASAPIFHIRAGKDYSADFAADGHKKVAQFDAVGGAITEQTIDSPLYELDGKLQVYVQHYLFLESQLDLKSPGTREIIIQDTALDLSETESDGTVQIGHLEQLTPNVQTEKFLKRYRFDQKRRMRSSETHYLDHPLMGIIIQVRRVAG